MTSKKKENAQVVSQERLAQDIYSMWIKTEAAAEAKPGQFISMYTNDGSKLLPRPISICEIDKENGSLRVVYRVTGKNTGTEEFAKLQAGDTIPVIGPLGNGFPLSSGKVAVVGGGFGVAPLLSVAKSCKAAGAEVRIYNGFASVEREMLSGLFAEYGTLTVCTDDGSAGYHGFPFAALESDMNDGFAPDVIMCCGPAPLMRAVKKLGESRGITTYLSLEQRMGCGVGACLTCTCKVDGHNKRVCKDGPVFLSTEVQP